MASELDETEKDLAVQNLDLLIIEFALLRQLEERKFLRIGSLPLGVKVLVIDVPARDEDILYCIEAGGASGYLLQNASLKELEVNLAAIARGETVCPPKIAHLAFCRMSWFARLEANNGLTNGVSLTRRDIYDRGFASFSLMYLLIHQEKTKHFVMRCKQGFNKEISDFMLSLEDDKIINLGPNYRAIHKMKEYGYTVFLHTTIRIRMIKVVLETGETEVLLTNLCDQEKYKREIFKTLYFMRWKIETSYNQDKNVLQLGEFSGHSLWSIEQDFYAATFVSNLQSIIEKQCESHLKNKNKIRKHDYQINRTLSIGSMKNKITALFLTKEPKIVLLELQNLFERHLEPIRLNRNYERRKSKITQTGKYKPVTNYKRVV